MSSFWLNLRIGYWHLQVGRCRPWIAIRFNDYRAERGAWRPLIELHR